MKQNVKQDFLCRSNMQKVLGMGIRMIEKLISEIRASRFDVSAIEMSPQYHLKIVQEMVSNGAQEQDSRIFMGIPILFVMGDDSYCRLLNAEQHKLRDKYIDLLKLYKQKYKQFKLFINNTHKFESGAEVQFTDTSELESIVQRLNKIENQIKLFSNN